MKFDKQKYWERRKKGLRGQEPVEAQSAKESNPNSRPAKRRLKREKGKK